MAERASLENWRPRKGSASSNLAPSAIFSRTIPAIEAGTVAKPQCSHLIRCISGGVLWVSREGLLHRRPEPTIGLLASWASESLGISIRLILPSHRSTRP